MKNKKFYFFIIFIIMLLTIGHVKALEFNEKGYYINHFNIEMTKDNINNLFGLGFTEEQIKTMQEVTRI